jgi:hypothetical protein
MCIKRLRNQYKRPRPGNGCRATGRKLSPDLSQSLPSGLLPSDFPPKAFYVHSKRTVTHFMPSEIHQNPSTPLFQIISA